MDSVILSDKRRCGDCTACCEGWLHGQAYDNYFYRGRPCHFMKKGVGCSIYAKRPDNPCQTYKCAWLTEYTLPDWMQPTQSNVILTWRTDDNKKTYLEMTEMDSKVRSEVLSYVIQYAANLRMKIHYQVSGGWNTLDFS